MTLPIWRALTEMRVGHMLAVRQIVVKVVRARGGDRVQQHVCGINEVMCTNACRNESCIHYESFANMERFYVFATTYRPASLFVLFHLHLGHMLRRRVIFVRTPLVASVPLSQCCYNFAASLVRQAAHMS